MSRLVIHRPERWKADDGGMEGWRAGGMAVAQASGRAISDAIWGDDTHSHNTLSSHWRPRHLAPDDSGDRIADQARQDISLRLDDQSVYRWPITWYPPNPERLHRPGLPRAGIDGAAARPKRHSLKQSVVFVKAAANDPKPSSVVFFDIMSLFSWAGGTSAPHRQDSFHGFSGAP